jgi:flagellin-like protein
MDGSAQSHVVAALLLVAVTLILAALVWLMLLAFINFDNPANPPAIIKIERLVSENEEGHLNYDSRVILTHTGSEIFQNEDLRAEVFRNGIKLPLVIRTFHGHEFISTPHVGVQTMAGLGCSGTTWYPGEKVVLDLSDGTFRPGDLIRVDILKNSRNAVISRHSLRA